MRTDFSKQNEEAAALAFREGDLNGIRQLFTAWYPPLCAYTRSLTQDTDAAEEISSEAFLKTWHHRRQFHSADGIRAYLFTVAKRDAYRWRQKKRHWYPPEQIAAVCTETDHSQVMIRNEMFRLLHHAIRELPPRCREVLQLLYIQGKKTEEVARQLAISPYTVRAQKARGISLLRPKLNPFLQS